MTPGVSGEGKTCTSISLTQGLGYIGKNVVLGLRQPSAGPVFGLKGSASGTGRAQVIPEDAISLHFTGDIHAVETAHNLAASAIGQQLYFKPQKGIRNPLGVDISRITWPYTYDFNCAELRNVTVGDGVEILGRKLAVKRDSHFIIGVASEVMAILALATDFIDLRQRLDRIILAYNTNGDPITVADLGVGGAMAFALEDAFNPNLVQTMEGQPVLVHCGPFANIAHGCNSIIANMLGLKLADYYATEAGFAADLGAEKFFDIVCRLSGAKPSLAVIIATAKALAENGGYPDAESNFEKAMEYGFANLAVHVANIGKFGVPSLVAINRFPQDADSHLALIKRLCSGIGVRAEINDGVAKGGPGAEELARAVVEMTEAEQSAFHPIYPVPGNFRENIDIIAQQVYRARGVMFSETAETNLAGIARLIERGLVSPNLLVCMAKTQYSLTDDPKQKNAPQDWDLHVQEVRLSAGAGFVVPVTGKISLLPALPLSSPARFFDYEGYGLRR